MGKPTAICFFVPDQKYVQLVFVLLHRWAPTTHLILLLLSSFPAEGKEQTDQKLCLSPKMPQPNQKSILTEEKVRVTGNQISSDFLFLDGKWEMFCRKIQRLSKIQFPLSIILNPSLKVNQVSALLWEELGLFELWFLSRSFTKIEIKFPLLFSCYSIVIFLHIVIH